MTTDKKKPNGDVDNVSEKLKPKPGDQCPADHSRIRGRNCGYCGTYFRGDDNG